MTRAAVIYLSRTGVMEPLGQSQILPYLRGIAAEMDLTLISRERAEDFADTERFARLGRHCADLGIDWRPRRFVASPGVMAAAWDTVLLSFDALSALWRRRGSRGRVLHARSYLPSLAALVAGKMANVPFVFDMRALWPEELITARRITRDSVIHRVLARLEALLLENAGATVVLTHAAQSYLAGRWPKQARNARFAMIPTCVDLDRFRLRADRGLTTAGGPGKVHGVIGSVLTGWFRTALLARWFAAVATRDPESSFEIITRDDAAAVRRAVDPYSRLGTKLTVGARSPDEMPDAICRHDVSVFFYEGGETSELGRSPTRFAEVLAAGLPVVTTSGVGDVEGIVRRYGIGVVLDGDSDAALERALGDLDALLAVPDLPRHCRAAAEAEFSLDKGTRAYLELYRTMLGQSDSGPDATG